MCCLIWGGRSSNGPTAIDLLLLILISCSVDDLPMALNLLFAPDDSPRWCLFDGGWLCPPGNKWPPATDWCIEGGTLDTIFGRIDWCGSDGGASEEDRWGGGYGLLPCKCLFLGWSGHKAGTTGSRKSIILFCRVGILPPMLTPPCSSCGLKIKDNMVFMSVIFLKNWSNFIF